MTDEDVAKIVYSLHRVCRKLIGHDAEEDSHCEIHKAAAALVELNEWRREVVDCLNPLRKGDPVWALGRNMLESRDVVGQIERIRELAKERDDE